MTRRKPHEQRLCTAQVTVACFIDRPEHTRMDEIMQTSSTKACTRVEIRTVPASSTAVPIAEHKRANTRTQTRRLISLRGNTPSTSGKVPPKIVDPSVLRTIVETVLLVAPPRLAALCHSCVPSVLLNAVTLSVLKAAKTAELSRLGKG